MAMKLALFHLQKWSVLTKLGNSVRSFARLWPFIDLFFLSFDRLALYLRRKSDEFLHPHEVLLLAKLSFGKKLT